MSDLSNHTEAVNDWLNRSYSETLVASFTRIALATASRTLRADKMVTTYSAPLAQSIDLPLDFAELYFIRHDQVRGLPLNYVSKETMYSGYPCPSPNSYTLIGTRMVLDERIASLDTDIEISYFARPPMLSNVTDTSVEPNWMVDYYYDILLWGTLLAATAYGLDDARIPTWQAAFGSAIDAANTEFLKSSVSGSVIRMPARKGFG